MPHQNGSLLLRLGIATLFASFSFSASLAQTPQTLAAARAGKGPETITSLRNPRPAPKPPSKILQMITYPAPNGATSAYITPPDKTPGRHAAIIWISGGDTAIGDFWSRQPRENDQRAATFRDAGMVVFYPSLRGLNANPGSIEGFYGEVDDLLAATAWLKQQPNVDPEQIYLGGHSTGGTLVMLAAETANVWKGVFSFGPVRDPRGYGNIAPVPIAPDNEKAALLRSPGKWLSSVSVPLYVFEGDHQSNVREVEAMQKENSNPNIRFRIVQGCNHFSVLRPVSEIIAQKIVANHVNELDDPAILANLCAK